MLPLLCNADVWVNVEKKKKFENPCERTLPQACDASDSTDQGLVALGLLTWRGVGIQFFQGCFWFTQGTEAEPF